MARNRLDALADDVRGMAAEPFIRRGGTVMETGPGFIRAAGMAHAANLGELARVEGGGLAEVVRVGADGALLAPFDDGAARVGDSVWAEPSLVLHPSDAWLGRAVNALGAPVDAAGLLERGAAPAPIHAPPPPWLKRQRLHAPVKTGVRAIDMFCPLVAGQRIGLFAGSGVGKSTLLAMLTKGAAFDVAVLALIGERGREAREFLEDVLGGRRDRAVAVVATGYESAMMRRLAPYTALAIAEHFRDRGANVLLAVDSITRFAHAAREIALMAGEPPVARGFPPSVFAALPKLLERAGPGEEGAGTITGFFTVLVDGDDHNDPIADAVRGALDGHIVLDRAIADQGRYPAIDILKSVSRLADVAWSAEERRAVRGLKALAAQFEDTRDLRAIGGYMKGADESLDRAVDMVPNLYAALQQRPDEPLSADAYAETLKFLQ